MRVSELASRYAKALFEMTKEAGNLEKVLAELRDLQTIFSKDESIQQFLTSPLVKQNEREAVMASALKNAGVSAETAAFVMLLANKARLGIFPEVVEAISLQSDLSHGVTRGTVRSAAVLSPEERKNIEDIVSKFTKKQVIMNYKEDPSVIGGLIAQVGSYTFDDTLTSHLRRLKDEMTRRVQ